MSERVCAIASTSMTLGRCWQKKDWTRGRKASSPHSCLAGGIFGCRPSNATNHRVRGVNHEQTKTHDRGLRCTGEFVKVNYQLKEFIIKIATCELCYQFEEGNVNILNIKEVFEDMHITKLGYFGFTCYTKDPVFGAYVKYPLLDEKMLEELRADDFKLYKELATKIYERILLVAKFKIGPGIAIINSRDILKGSL